MKVEKRDAYLGIGLLLAGLFYIANNLGLVRVRLQWWPLAILLPGMVFLVLGATRVSGMLFPGVIISGVGSFFLLWSNHLLPGGMDFWWPIFPTIVGVAFFVFAAQIGTRALLIPGSIVLGVGLIFFLINISRYARRFSGPWLGLALVLAGLALMAKRERNA